jgi:hypothetical protein
MTGRALLLAAALIAAAWFALGIRQASDTAGAAAIVTSPAPLTPARARDAVHLLRAAGVLNPDTTVAQLRGRLQLREGHPQAALRTLERVARLEPMNLQAWEFVAQAALPVDRRELEVALVHISRLYRQSFK